MGAQESRISLLRATAKLERTDEQLYPEEQTHALDGRRASARAYLLGAAIHTASRGSCHRIYSEAGREGI